MRLAWRFGFIPSVACVTGFIVVGGRRVNKPRIATSTTVPCRYSSRHPPDNKEAWPGDDDSSSWLTVNDSDDASLSHSISSPERYAAALGLTIQQVQDIQDSRSKSRAELQKQLEAESDGTVKHKLICQYRFTNGKHPFVCKTCWSYYPICICGDVPAQKREIPCERVILWTHHREWGSPTNSGSLLPLLLEHTQLLMKGLHEDELARILEEASDSNVQPVILWPDMNTHKDGPAQQDFVTLNELAGSKIILIAMEGTWRQARRMVSKFSYPRLSLENITTTTGTRSLFAPLRASKSNKDSVCTAEAVVAALQGMGMPPDPHILQTVRKKVEQTHRYQGKPAARRTNKE